MMSFGDVMVDEGVPNPALYSAERDVENGPPMGTVIHIWDETHAVPVDVIRSVCEHLDLDPELFGFRH